MFAKPAGTPGGGENSHQGRLQTATNADGGPLVRRAVDLFEFLARAQQLKADPPRTTDAYERDGKVLWLSDLPVHNAVHAAHHVPTPDPDDPILVIDRVPRVDSPQVPEELVPWVVGDVDDPDKQLLLRESAYLASSQQERHDPADSLEAPEHSLVFLADRPDLAEAFDEWFQAWSFWADREREDRSTRAIYRELFSAYVKATSQPEEFELIVGVGSLAWRPGGHSPLRRHVLTAPATITFHDDTGQIAVSREVASDGLRVELDMVEPDLIRNPGHVSDFRARAASFEAHPLDRVRVEELMHRFVNSLDADGQYVDADSQPNWAPTANAAFAPAVILRRRSQVGLVEVFTTIARQIAEAGQVPSGLLPLLDPDHTPTVDPEPIEGAVVVVDDDVFLPMPLNDVQLRIVRRVESHAQTLVQGPPGTGKTHTAAALITHLLAQGKRVLVTAHTDRALKEVRGKLPESIKPLSVAIVGAARDDLTDLKVAVERIAAMSVEHDHVAAEQQIGRHLESIDGFRRQRAERYRRLLEARSNEVSSHSHAGREGTLAAIAQQYLAEADRYGWLAEYVIPGQDLEVPLSDAEAIEWLSYLRDRALANDLEEASRRLIPFDQMPSASVFATLIDHERATS